MLLFDEPTSGLDPITARTVDTEIIKLRDVERVTSILVTHQPQDAFYVATHEAARRNEAFAIVAATGAKDEEIDFVMLKDGCVYFEGHVGELRRTSDSYLKTFLSDLVPATDSLIDRLETDRGDLVFRRAGRRVPKR